MHRRVINFDFAILLRRKFLDWSSSFFLFYSQFLLYSILRRNSTRSKIQNGAHTHTHQLILRKKETPTQQPPPSTNATATSNIFNNRQTCHSVLLWKKVSEKELSLSLPLSLSVNILIWKSASQETLAAILFFAPTWAQRERELERDRENGGLRDVTQLNQA